MGTEQGLDSGSTFVSGGALGLARSGGRGVAQYVARGRRVCVFNNLIYEGPIVISVRGLLKFVLWTSRPGALHSSGI